MNLVRKHLRSDLIGGWAIFLTTFVIFLLSPVRTVLDSKYSMLFSQELLWHGRFSLDRHVFPELKDKNPNEVLIHRQNLDYRLFPVGGRLFYYPPAGSTVLSMPFVALMNAFGISTVDRDGTYNHRGEVTIEIGLAALLMAGLTTIVFRTSRLLLPFGWSLLIAVATALGTQVWSTASRALWNDTWGIFIMGFVVWQLLRDEVRRVPYHPVLLATSLAWLYFIRPTFSVPISAIAVYVFLYRRSTFTPFALTGSVWAAIFISYSQYHFGRSQPHYFGDHVSLLNLATFPTGLAGTLISPSRGLLIYVPVLLFAGYLLLRYRSSWVTPRFVVLAAAVIAGHIVMISVGRNWHAGHSYGPRYTTSLVPWFALIGILAVAARLRWRDTNPEDSAFRWRAEWICGAFLLLSSVTLNGIGAMSRNAFRWNTLPINVDVKPDRVWDWKHPQFLAPFQNDRYPNS